MQRHIKPGVPPLEWRVRLQMALGAGPQHYSMFHLYLSALSGISRLISVARLLGSAQVELKCGLV